MPQDGSAKLERKAQIKNGGNDASVFVLGPELAGVILQRNCDWPLVAILDTPSRASY
jgi:hypothetical protein